MPFIFDAIDVDHDDGISSNEFGNYFKSLGLEDNKFADDVFQAMDFNSDGSLSQEGLLIFKNFILIYFLLKFINERIQWVWSRLLFEY